MTNGSNFKNMLMTTSKKILLLSGGADSMYLYQTDKFDECVFFDYGQKHKLCEYEMCSQYITDIIEIGELVMKGKEVNMRNMLFITTIVSKYGNENLNIYIGMNADDKYPDNNRGFYDELENLMNKISFNVVKIITPLQHMKKTEIVDKIKLKYYTD